MMPSILPIHIGLMSKLFSLFVKSMDNLKYDTINEGQMWISYYQARTK